MSRLSNHLVFWGSTCSTTSISSSSTHAPTHSCSKAWQMIRSLGMLTQTIALLDGPPVIGDSSDLLRQLWRVPTCYPTCFSRTPKVRTPKPHSQWLEHLVSELMHAPSTRKGLISKATALMISPCLAPHHALSCGLCSDKMFSLWRHGGNITATLRWGAERIQENYEY